MTFIIVSFCIIIYFSLFNFTDNLEIIDSTPAKEKKSKKPKKKVTSQEARVDKEEPVVEEPVVEEPDVEEPVVEEPLAEEAVAEKLPVEKPVAKEPVLEEPVVEQPIVKEPELGENKTIENGEVSKPSKPKKKLTPMKIERVSLDVNKAQFAEELEGPQFAKLKLKKPTPKTKTEQSSVTLPKFQLKSRIKHVTDWPPEELNSTITYLNSVRQNGELSRNIKEAAKIKKKPIKLKQIDHDKPELEKPEDFDFTSENVPSEDANESVKDKTEEREVPEEKTTKKILEKEIPEEIKPEEPKKPKIKLTPQKIERKVLEMDKAQHAESVEGPQFNKVKLKKTVAKQKQDNATVSLPKFQLKSRITYVRDWPPETMIPTITFLGSVRQNGILSRNVKEAAKIKKKPIKELILPDLEKTELEKPSFGHEDIIESIKPSEAEESDQTFVPDDEPKDEHAEFTINRRPSVKVHEEIVDEFTIKKKLKPTRKPSVTLPEITEPETVTFRPKSTKTKEDVEQEFSIQLDSYAEEEISMSSKVKLKPQRQPTFSEAAGEASIKFYEEEDGPDIVEIIESEDQKEDETANVMMPIKKKPKELSVETTEDVKITMTKPKSQERSEITQDVNLKLERGPKYVVDDQEEVSFDVKPQIEQFTSEELSLSSKITLKPKKRVVISEAADEHSIQLTQEIEDDSQTEEIIISDVEEENENVQMVFQRKPKKPAYEVSEVEELSVELKPKRMNEIEYEEEQLTILAKRKPSQLQGKPIHKNFDCFKLLVFRIKIEHGTLTVVLKTRNNI